MTRFEMEEQIEKKVAKMSKRKIVLTLRDRGYKVGINTDREELDMMMFDELRNEVLFG